MCAESAQFLLHILEAYDTEAKGFTTFLDFVYFSVVTVSTVGFGDFTPIRKESRFIAILFIFLIMSMMPRKIHHIADLWNTQPVLIGTMSTGCAFPPPSTSGTRSLFSHPATKSTS